MNYQQKLDCLKVTPSGAIGAVAAQMKQSNGIPFETSWQIAKKVYPQFKQDEAEHNAERIMLLHRLRSGISQKRFETLVNNLK